MRIVWELYAKCHKNMPSRDDQTTVATCLQRKVHGPVATLVHAAVLLKNDPQLTSHLAGGSAQQPLCCLERG